MEGDIIRNLDDIIMRRVGELPLPSRTLNIEAEDAKRRQGRVHATDRRMADDVLVRDIELDLAGRFLAFRGDVAAFGRFHPRTSAHPFVDEEAEDEGEGAFVCDKSVLLQERTERRDETRGDEGDLEERDLAAGVSIYGRG